MFGKSRKKDIPISGNPASLKNPMTPEQELGTVHTMPDRFLQTLSQSTASDKKHGNKKKIIIIIIAVIAVIIIAAIVVLARLFSSGSTIEPIGGTTNAGDVNALVKNLNSQNKNAGNANNTNTVRNTNTNSSNTNANSNSNANVNINGSNTNTGNVNVNTNSNTNASAIPSSSEDTDFDELTNLEEDLYGTRLNRADSDADGFNDGEEVMNVYDPLGNGKLSNSPQVDQYVNTTFAYTLLHPKVWTAEALSGAQSNTVLFTADTGEFMEVLIVDNTDKLTARQWYLKQFPENSDADVESIQSKDGLKGVLSVDGLTAYYANDSYIFSIVYQVGAKEEQSFHSTFVMMYTSFSLNISNANSNSNTNTNSNSNSNRNSNANSNTNSGL